MLIENTYTVMTATVNSVTLLNEFIRQGKEHNVPLAKSGGAHCQAVERLEGEASDNSVVT